ncbi:sigma 54-interacting transcriptional regulator [Marinobacterium rhizophilum]|uniref:sigma 54-interacting transcriptional regulator n=1 Tax=Marinobacterium rhizophilum TaxID=420402 RepID=UPI00035E3FB7|nr:sigma 54-interacting transcriptional regulator [Marinobacterium rhizophilum]
MHPVCFIAPYKKLANLASRRAAALALNIDVIEGDLYEGLAAARNGIRFGNQIVISRGGTAQLIDDQLDVKVVHLRYTPFDFLEHLGNLPGRTCAVIGFADLVPTAEKTYGALGLSLLYINLDMHQDQESLTELIRLKGVNLIIGDAAAGNIAMRGGVDFKLVETGESSIDEALKSASEYYQYMFDMSQKQSQLVQITNAIDCGFLLVDESLNIVRSKDHYDLNIQSPTDIDQKISRLIQEKREVKGEVFHRQGDDYTYSIYPIYTMDQWDGALILMHAVEQLNDISGRVRKNLRSRGFYSKYRFSDILHNSKVMAACVDKAMSYAVTASSIMINGESGTGKELLAQSIHSHSAFSEGPFIAINCSAIPAGLVESELFGYAEGAFTGARRSGKAGLFEQAHDGTLFLDEVDALDMSAQAKILRALQEREIVRVGDSKVIPVNIRIISASNKCLPDEIRGGRFRQDLYYRLNVLHLKIPPLRERLEDLVPMFTAFFERLSGERREPALGAREIEQLQQHSWPGNVRELQNICERYFLTGALDFDAFDQSEEAEGGTALDLYRPLRKIEEQIVLALYDAEGSISKVSTILGIDRATVRKKLNESGTDAS